MSECVRVMALLSHLAPEPYQWYCVILLLSTVHNNTKPRKTSHISKRYILTHTHTDVRIKMTLFLSVCSKISTNINFTMYMTDRVKSSSQLPSHYIRNLNMDTLHIAYQRYHICLPHLDFSVFSLFDQHLRDFDI